MRLWKYASPVLTLVALGGFAVAAYATRDKWTPYVFPQKSAGKSEEEKKPEHVSHEERITLSAQAQANLGLDKEGAVDTLTPQEAWRKVAIPGVVVDRPGQSDRSVTARTAGIVTEIMASPGDTVRAGDPLFTLQLAGEFVQSTQTDLAKVSKDLAAAMTRRDQTKRLVDAGTKPGAELVEDENQVNRLTTQVQGHRRQLVVFGLSPEQVARAERGDAITEVTVTAPTQPTTARSPILTATSVNTLYEVQELKVDLGVQVQAGQTLCTLANHQSLFIEGRAFKSEAAALAEAAERKLEIEAEFADEPPGAWKPTPGQLTIHHLSNQVDTATRTFAFYVPLENQPKTFERHGKTHFVWRFRPGQRVRLKVPVEKLVTLSADGKKELLPFVLPSGAVIREGPEAFVFVQSGDLFRRKPVRVLYADQNEVVIARDGSVSGAEFVVRTPAAAAINRAMKAAAAAEGGGGHHGHSHD